MTVTAARAVAPVTAVRRTMLSRRVGAGLVALISALIYFRILHEGGYALDDFRNLGQARSGLSLHLLFEPIGGAHLQPVTRFLEWLTATPFHTSYTATIIVLSVLCGLGTYWLMRLLDTLWGPRPPHIVIGFLFGTSALMIGASQWVSSAAVSATCVYLAAGACYGFFRWLSSGSRSAYALSLVATLLAVCSWEAALATPAIITLIWICFARDWQPQRRALFAQLPCYAIPLAYLVYVEFQPWHQSLSLPAVGYELLLLVVMVGRTLAASVIGTAVPGGPQSAFEWFSAMFVVAVLVSGMLCLALRRRFAWRVLVVFVLGTVLVTIPVSTTRSFLAASFVGTTPRYVTFLPFLLAVAVAGGARPALSREALAGTGAGERARSEAWLWKALAWGCISLAACVLYITNLAHTFNKDQFSIAMGTAGSSQANNIGAGIAALGRAGERSLVDATVPFPVWYQANDGTSELSSLMPYWSVHARTFGEGSIAGIDKNGVVRWATFHAGAAGPQYARVVVRAPVATTVLVRISANKPTQPETPWRIPVAPGTHSLTLTTWSTKVRGVAVGGHDVSVVSVRAGTITLGPIVTSAG
jgi:hypothetical protein